MSSPLVHSDLALEFGTVPVVYPVRDLPVPDQETEHAANSKGMFVAVSVDPVGSHAVGHSDPFAVDDQIFDVIIQMAKLGEKPDETMLRRIATDNLYVPITNADILVEFISAVGSSGASTSGELRNIIDDLESLRQMDIDEEAADGEDGDER